MIQLYITLTCFQQCCIFPTRLILLTKFIFQHFDGHHYQVLLLNFISKHLNEHDVLFFIYIFIYLFFPFNVPLLTQVPRGASCGFVIPEISPLPVSPTGATSHCCRMLEWFHRVKTVRKKKKRRGRGSYASKRSDEGFKQLREQRQELLL